MSRLAVILLFLLPFSTRAQNDTSDVVVRLEFAALYTFGIPQGLGLVPKLSVQAKASEFGMGLVFQQKIFPNPEIVSPNENSTFVSGLYGFYNRRVNKNPDNAFCIQYNALFQQSMVFKLNEVNYLETAKLVNALDQTVGYTYKKRLLNKLYFRQSTGVGVVTYFTGTEYNQSRFQFGNSKFGLSGMIDLGLAYDIR